MAWGVFTFNKEGRLRLSSLLRALLIAQLVVSLSMIIFCYNISVRVMTLLKDIHKITILLLYSLIILQTYCMKIHYTSGLRLVSIILQNSYWSRVYSMCRTWLLTGSLVTCNGVLVYIACRSTLKELMKDLSSSIRDGISQYLTEPSWKRLIDTMQVELSCCGADKPSDWHDIAWINMDFLNQDSEFVMKLAGLDGKIISPVTPFSCCTPRVLSACYHDPLQQAKWRQMWNEGSPLVSATLHTRGCVEAVRAPLTRVLLALQIFNAFVFIFQVFIVLLAQLLRTSAHDAALSGDQSGVGRACLWGTLDREQKRTKRRNADRGESASTYGMSLQRRRRVRRSPRTTGYSYLS